MTATVPTNAEFTAALARITTAENNITAILARLGTDETNIANLTARVTKLEGSSPPPPPPPPTTVPIPTIIANRNPVLTFNDEFDSLDVSRAGPPTSKWYYTDPDNYGYGGAAALVYDPANGINPFSVNNSIVSMKGWNDGNGWKSGTLVSMGPTYQGFSQKYGYFEARMKLANTSGPWSGLWLLSLNAEAAKYGGNSLEIDISEGFSSTPTRMTGTVHWWGPNGEVRSWMGHSFNDDFAPANFCTDFHTFGALWEPGKVTWYIDGVQHYTSDTGTENIGRTYVILSQLFDPAGISAQTANPCFMQVDWVRVWQVS